MYNLIKRCIDLFASIIGLFLLLPLFLIVAILIYIDDPGKIIFKQKRVGKDNKVFNIYKFRSMKLDTPNVATHLLSDSNSYITKIGAFIRKTSIDELPQLMNIIKGDMTLVGPRPALYNQYDLIDLRKKFSIDRMRPGITGLAQINGRDEIDINEKVMLDKEYLESRSITLDIKIIILTFLKVISREGVRDE